VGIARADKGLAQQATGREAGQVAMVAEKLAKQEQPMGEQGRRFLFDYALLVSMEHDCCWQVNCKMASLQKSHEGITRFLDPDGAAFRMGMGTANRRFPICGRRERTARPTGQEW
jgi:hypothetical protein